MEKKNEPKPYSVYRQWHDNPNEKQVIEYFASVRLAVEFIRQQKKDGRYTWHVGVYK